MTNFKAFTYAGKKTARKVLDTFEYDSETYLWGSDVL